MPEFMDMHCAPASEPERSASIPGRGSGATQMLARPIFVLQPAQCVRLVCCLLSHGLLAKAVQGNMHSRRRPVIQSDQGSR